MGAILKIQLSAFSNKRISPSAENIAVIMPKLKELSGIEFLPSVINSQKIDISTGAIESIPNLSFISIDNLGQIICSQNRIDCLLNYGIEKQEETEKGFEIASKIIQFIMNKENILANRLALNVTYISDICSEDSAFETRVVHVMPFYQDKKIKEWSFRTNASGTIIINGIEENLNIITEYTHDRERTANGNRILCHADINTVPENEDFRFSFDIIDDFESQAKDIFANIQTELEKLVGDGK